MPTFNHIGGAEPSTLTFKVATVSQTRNSSLMHQEILAIGDPDTSNAIAAVLNTTPASTAWGLVTRPLGPVSIQGNSTVVQGTSPWIIGGNSTVIQGTNPWVVTPTSTAYVKSMGLSVDSSNALNIKIDGSTSVSIINGNSSVTITAVAGAAGKLNIGSTAADNAVLISGNSTVVIVSGNSSVIVTSGQITSTCVQGTNPWIIAGNSTVAPLAGSTWATRPIQSSATDLRTMAVTMDGSSNTIESSTRAVGTNSTMRGLAVRSIMPAFLTTASSNVFASTTWTIATSNAATIQYVYAYSITTTNQTPTKIGFYAGSTLVWPIVLAAISSAVSGVNLAVSPPAYLFAGATGAILQMKTASASTGGGYKAGVSYWTE